MPYMSIIALIYVVMRLFPMTAFFLSAAVAFIHMSTAVKLIAKLIFTMGYAIFINIDTYKHCSDKLGKKLVIAVLITEESNDRK